MDLQEFLVLQFTSWSPRAPEVVSRTKGDITLSWSLEQFAFLRDSLIYRLEKNNKLPQWIVVYSGGKTTKTIYDLPPSYPHKFRLKVILKGDAIPSLARRALDHYGDENTVYKAFQKIDDEKEQSVDDETQHTLIGEDETTDDTIKEYNVINEQKVKKVNNQLELNVGETRKKDNIQHGLNKSEKRKWVESRWSEETWTSTDTDGSSAVCFSMAVKCGYIKQIQSMLEERPDLIGIVNSNTGFTPLATAIRKGNLNIVKFLVSLGADVDAPSATGQRPLQLAALHDHSHIAHFLLDRGAHLQLEDWNGLRAEHYAVESGSVEMLRLVLDRGGDVRVRDNNGWTPLFRAVCQGAKTEVVLELVMRGSELELTDNAGLPLTSVARQLKNRHGTVRDSILRLVDSNYPHEKARSHFTRISRKIHNLQQLLNLI